jgi:uncharacterized membrane protein YkgB
MEGLNWLAIGVVTVANFIFGALWFSLFFGKQWMWIHHGDKAPSEKEMKEMSKGMWVLMVSEFVVTTLMIIGLACIIRAIPEYSGLQNAFMVWLAFVMPMVVSGVLWGNDRKEWRMLKIILSSSYRLVALLAAGYVLAMW